MRGELTGTGQLVRLHLRSHRVRLSVWTGSLIVAGFYFTHAIQALLPTQRDLAGMAIFFTTPTTRAMVGPVFGLENPDTQTFFAGGYLLYLMILGARCHRNGELGGTRLRFCDDDVLGNC